jgi:uncharacterized membrane protein
MVFACNLTNGAVSGFCSIIAQPFGVSYPYFLTTSKILMLMIHSKSNATNSYSSLKTILLLGVAGAFVFIFLLVSGTISVFIRNTRTLCAMFCCLPVMAGSIMIWRSDWELSKAIPLWRFLFTSVSSTTFVMILTLMAANTAGHTKKAVTAGIVWVSYCASNGIARLTVKIEEEADHYPTAFITILAMMSLIFLL